MNVKYEYRTSKKDVVKVQFQIATNKADRSAEILAEKTLHEKFGWFADRCRGRIPRPKFF